MSTFQCDEVLIQAIIREYDEKGKPIGERSTQGVKIFRAKTPNIWEEIDKDVQTLQSSMRKE
jgi:hypothetical protein